MNVYKELLTKSEALTAVRNQLFSKMIDVEINLRATKRLLDKTTDSKERASKNEAYAQIEKDYNILKNHIELIDTMLAEEKANVSENTSGS